MRGEIRGHSTSFDRSSVPGRRNGFALAAALLALLLIAALVTGVFFAATEETHVGAASAERQLTLSASGVGHRVDDRRVEQGIDR